MSDRIVVMNGGIADQVGTPFEVYNRPATRFVAQFVGTLSLIDATVTDHAAGSVSLGETVMSGLALPPDARAGDSVTLALRPESVRRAGRPGDASLSGTVASVDFLGSVMRTKIDAGNAVIAFDAFNDPSLPPPERGDRMSVHFAPDAVLVLQK